MRKNLLQIFILLFFPISLWGQADSIILSADQLLLPDVNPYEAAETNQQVFAATRSLKDLKDLPFTVYVITKKEIRDNGYRTLVDALKMQPGILVSQPGSALEGETFLMRGLLGNAYTKILLNGNPIKPTVVKGMPIGAQIPIQQAERIEIIYGAVGTLYGADANSGIVNIVLEETERPVYTQANLSMGTNEYSNLDVSFGGKLGKRKNVLRYSLFGSYTYRQDWKTNHQEDTTLFNPETYSLNDFDYTKLQNYVSVDGKPLFNNLPHQSRLLGVGLAYRNMTLTAEAMYRRDHSSVGLNPLAVSYTNPLNYIGERIININFGLRKSYRQGRWGFEVKAGYLQYQLDSRSSFDFLYNSTAEILDALTLIESTDENTGNFDETKYDTLTENNYQRYFNDTRFSFSESHDARLELIFNFKPIKNLDIKAGFLPQVYNSVPMVNYSKVPLGSVFLQNKEAPFNPELTPFGRTKIEGGVNLIGFAQAYWSLQNWTILAGVQGLRNYEDYNDLRKSVDTRIGIQYQFNDVWSARASYSSAVRIPPAFYTSTAYRIQVSTFTSNSIRITDNPLRPENTKSAELGMRWTPNKNHRFDLVGFHAFTENLVSYFLDAEVDADGQPFVVEQGFRNSDLSTLRAYGVQSNYWFRSRSLDFSFNWTLNYGSQEKAGFGINSDTSVTPFVKYPRSIRKTRIVTRPTERISFTFDTIFMSSSKSNFEGTERVVERSKFRNFDVLANYNINRNFRVFAKLRNIFNKEYAGINATETLNDLNYNPQEKRTYRLGMSYRID